MKKLAIISTLLIACSLKALCYDFTNKEMALIGYNLTLSTKAKALIEKHNPSIFATPKSETKFWYLCYNSVESYMKMKGINAFPYQCFDKKASYDSYGFPKIAVASAVKTGISKFYYKLDIDISVVEQSEGKAKLSVKMWLTPFKSPSIIPMDKLDVDVETEVTLNNQFLEGFTRQADEVAEGTLMSAMNKAADKLTKVMIQK